MNIYEDRCDVPTAPGVSAERVSPEVITREEVASMGKDSVL